MIDMILSQWENNAENDCSMGKLCEMPIAIQVIHGGTMRNLTQLDVKLISVEEAANEFRRYVRFDDS
jgi:hypothetical protein